ncbi:hypothetical protein AMECASPLE_006045 [Ameca splendens]|uniref:Uncharacterized protein n=1 Tax=Ameca splendens TaxID=208324 RepID=A0ABV0Z991_9TELE
MEWKPRGRRQLVFSLGVITLHPLKTVHSLSASSHCGEGLIFPGLAKNPTPRDPAFVHQLQPWFQSDLYPCF